jgi:multiple sugar transport system permease protein
VLGYLFALPWIFGFLALTLGPMLFSLYASFTEYNIVSPPRWIGASNYRFILGEDGDFRKALGNTLYYVVTKTPLVISVSLFLALLMHMELPGRRYFRTIYYLPTVLTGVAAIFLWVWVLNPYGLLNRALGVIGIPGPNWFLDPRWSKPGLIVMGMWYIGGPMLILLAGLNGVPRQLYEAAEIDGAGTLRKFLNVTLPMLSPTIFFLIVTNIIGAFQVFNSAYVVSNTAGGSAGAPAQSLLFYEVYLYLRAFKQLEMGFASALAWILFVVVMVITGIQLWLSKRWVYYES